MVLPAQTVLIHDIFASSLVERRCRRDAHACRRNSPGRDRGNLMRIATYNILKGGSLRVHWAKMIEEHSVDLMLLQESYAPDEHLPPLQYPEARSRSVWEMVEKNGWSSAVFSRSGSVKAVSVAGFSGWVVGAEITGASWQSDYLDPLLAFSIHAPVFKGSYSKPVNKILDKIKRIAHNREIIIGGDFNLTVSKDASNDSTIGKRVAFLELGLRWTEIEARSHAFLIDTAKADKAATKKTLDERFALMREVFRRHRWPSTSPTSAGAKMLCGIGWAGSGQAQAGNRDRRNAESVEGA
jgi:exonuclease III